MLLADDLQQIGGDSEVTKTELSAIIEYLKAVKGWNDTEIIEFLQYISKN